MELSNLKKVIRRLSWIDHGHRNLKLIRFPLTTDIHLLGTVRFQRHLEDTEDGFFDKMEISLKTCAICLDYLKVGEFKITTCGHSFCTSCIDKAIDVRKICPLYSQPIDSSRVHDAYV